MRKKFREAQTNDPMATKTETSRLYTLVCDPNVPMMVGVELRSPDESERRKTTKLNQARPSRVNKSQTSGSKDEAKIRTGKVERGGTLHQDDETGVGNNCRRTKSEERLADKT